MIFVDTETTGVSSQVHGLLSIGAIDFNNPENEFYGECRAFDGARMSTEAFEVNGFSEESACDHHKISERVLVEKFIEWTKTIEDRTFAGENPSFDRDFIRAACDRNHIIWPFAYRTIDLHSVAVAHVLRQGREMVIKNGHSALSLDTISIMVGLPLREGAHNALFDARIEAEAFHRIVYNQKLLPEFKEFEIPSSLHGK
jgi:DNA polymerase III epsilon subunit-like protein